MERPQVGWADGLAIAVGRSLIIFDPRSRGGLKGARFISHAHRDHLHILQGGERTIATPQTLEMALAMMTIPIQSLLPREIGKYVKFDDTEVTIHNAGHMLGSAQFSVHTSDGTVVYTGDINCRDMYTTKAAERVACDTLVLETTYGSPCYAFPDLVQTSTEIVEWAMSEIARHRTPVFKVYSCGKPQEIIRIFNLFTTLSVVANSVVAATSRVYVRNGIPLDFMSSESADGIEALESGEAVLVTSSEVDGHVKKPSFAAATGWAMQRRFGSSAAFPLSSHADFQQLVQYVETVKPKEVLTLHGFREEFASYLSRKLHVSARPVPPLKQRVIEEYM